MSERHEMPGKGNSARRPARGDRPQGDARLDREHVVEQLRGFLNQTLAQMHLEIQFDIAPAPPGAGPEETEVAVAFHGADQDLLLERNAELLLAFEHLAHRLLRLDPRLHDRVRFDCGEYRVARLEELKLSARVAAQRVRETGQTFRFNPMSPRERRVIHLELNGASGVRTASEGTGDRRQLVIYPANKK